MPWIQILEKLNKVCDKICDVKNQIRGITCGSACCSTVDLELEVTRRINEERNIREEYSRNIPYIEIDTFESLSDQKERNEVRSQSSDESSTDQTVHTSEHSSALRSVSVKTV